MDSGKVVQQSRTRQVVERHYPLLYPVLLMTAITAVSATSHPQLPGGYVPHDKLAHFAVFGLLATSIVRLPLFRARRWWMLLVAIGVPAVFGMLDEVHQSFVPGRTPHWMDWVADAVGAVVAVFAYHWIPFYRRFLEWRVVNL